MNTMAHKKQGYRFENDWLQEHLETRTFQKYKAAATVPVNVEIEAEHHVLNLDNVKQILSKARTISIMGCVCRVKFGHCDAPVNTCIDMNEVAERNIANGVAQEITMDEALDVLERTHEAGLVHMAFGHGEFYEPGVVNSVCSCCSCCCSILSGILRFGLAPHLLTSHAVSVTDSSACTGCSECVDRCQFGARKIAEGSLAFNPDLCFGCGLCVSTCPANAITLIDKN
jgi:Pyruvate/2-oxoacid:ferredoxin oxidoreductase delta subunit